MTWKPRPTVEVHPKLGMALNEQWRFEQLIRAHTANLGAQLVVNLLQTTVEVRIKCHGEENPTLSSIGDGDRVFGS